MNSSGRRKATEFRPSNEEVEGRVLLATTSQAAELRALLKSPAAQAERPNTPVLPFAGSNKQATFIDTSATLVNGAHIALGGKSFVAPFATLNAASGFIKIGSGTEIQDNATIESDPSHVSPTTTVTINNNVLIGYDATVTGPSTIGGTGTNPTPTGIGPNAVINGATIEAGAIVGALAYVGPGVTVPTGFEVKPGADVTTNAQASDPALGDVTKISSTDLSNVTKELTDAQALAVGYITLYQGNSATGANPGATISGVFNGDLSTIEGISAEPGSTTVSFEPSSHLSPTFPAPRGFNLPADIYSFHSRIIGQVVFSQRVRSLSHALGRSNSIRADEGQPITISSITHTGSHVTINSPVSGTLKIGANLTVGNEVVIISGASVNAVLGDNLSIGDNAVIDRSSIGSNSTIGAGAYVETSTLPANTVIPPGAIVINGKITGYVQP